MSRRVRKCMAKRGRAKESLWPSYGRPKMTLISRGQIFFGLNKFPSPNGRLSPKACHTYLESLSVHQCISGQFKLAGNRIMGRQSFPDKLHSTFYDIWDLVISYCLLSEQKQKELYATVEWVWHWNAPKKRNNAQLLFALQMQS